MAPEFIDKRNFTQQSDIYSFGILLYEIFYPIKKENGKWQKNISPYQNLQAVQIMYQVVNDGLRPNLEIFNEIKDKYKY
jgi:serine/threonine protein kinase